MGAVRERKTMSITSCAVCSILTFMLAGNCMAAGPYPGAEFEAMHGGVGAPSVLMDPNWIALDPGTDCAGDINGDGMVGADDILAVLSDWGTCDGCPGDIDNDGIVGVNDLLTIIGAFGPC